MIIYKNMMLTRLLCPYVALKDNQTSGRAPVHYLITSILYLSEGELLLWTDTTFLNCYHTREAWDL